MISVDLAEATRHRRYPSVSLLVSIDPAAGPWPARLDAARREAERRLALEPLGPDTDLVSSLRNAVAHATIEPGASGLALFVNAEVASTVSLPVPVRDRVVVDETFATRDLVHALNRALTYWVLLLDQRRPRLLRGTGALLQPVLTDIPVASRLPAAADQRRRGRSGEPDPVRDRRLRDVDEAIRAYLASDDAPLLVVGTEPTLSQFVASTRHQRRLSGTLRRRTDGPLDELAIALEPHLDALLAERCDTALSELGRHLARRQAALGIDEAWEHAPIGGGDTLIVEDSYEYAARVRDWGLEPSEDRNAPDVVDDAVDELIEVVLARGGRVQIVPDGRLVDAGRLALLTRHEVRPRSAGGGL